MKMATIVKAMLVVTIWGASTYALWAQTANQSSWVGIWNGTLEGQPGVTLTLANDSGHLGGTIVFYMILGQPPSTQIGGKDVLMVMHPRFEGDTLLFQVTRTSDGKLLQNAARYIDSDKLELRCLDCGEDSPTTTLVRSRP